MFLTELELSQLTGYKPNQHSRMRKWLDDRGIAHTDNRLGQPVVLRSAIENKTDESTQPDFEWLKTA